MTKSTDQQRLVDRDTGALSVTPARAARWSALALLLVLGATARASDMELNLGGISAGGNATIGATLALPAASARLYFRREGFGDFYYVTLQAGAPGAYAAALPRPHASVEAVELFAAAFDEKGKELARTPMLIAGIEWTKSAATAPPSGPITVGNTVASQDGQPIAWFVADASVRRVTSSGSPSPGGSEGGSATPQSAGDASPFQIVARGNQKETSLYRP